MGNRRLQTLALLALAAVVLPLHADGGQAECSNLTTSLASTLSQPVKGDEAFFALPSGPANVMILVDTSGSMTDLPQCQNGPGTSGCSYPVWKYTAPGYLVGSCNLAGEMNVAPWMKTLPDLANPLCTASKASLTNPACPRVSQNWLDYFSTYKTVFPATSADPGYDNGTVVDAAPWTTAGGCSSSAVSTSCLFDPAKYIHHQLNGGGSSAWDANGSNPASNVTVTASPCANAWNQAECLNCLDTKGWYMFRQLNRSADAGCNVSAPTMAPATSNGRACFTGNTWFFKGDWLDANPPKYVSARRVVKELVKIDAAVPGKFDNIRFGLARFQPSNSSGFSTGLATTGDGARVVVPLGPDCLNSYPAQVANIRVARQAIIDAVNRKSPTGTRTTYLNFSSSTPLAEALFNVGQYFTSTGASSPYQTLFGAAWMRTAAGLNDLSEAAAGTWGAPWAQSNANQHSFCWACQTSSIVVVTDGAPNQDVNLPQLTAPPSGAPPYHATFDNDFRYFTNAEVDCPPTLSGTTVTDPGCGYDLGYGGGSNTAISNCAKRADWQLISTSGTTCAPNMMHKVAWFLNRTDMRPELTDDQTLRIYPISFGLDDSNPSDFTTVQALRLLQKVADLGQAKGPGTGLFANSSSADELTTALFNAVSDVVLKNTSFSAPSAASLQTSQSATGEVYLARFRPNATPAWEGHLFQGILFDEFQQGCDPSIAPGAQVTKVACGNTTVFPNFNGDSLPSGKNRCDGVFLVDLDCDEIYEDVKTGDYKKKKNAADANLAWDAGAVLSNPSKPGYRSASESGASPRNIWTWVGGARVAFTSANANVLAPWLNLGEATCAGLLKRIGMCGSAPLPACPVPGPGWPAAATTQCAEQVIHYVRGWDVTDQDGDGCAGPANPSNAAKCPGGVDGEERDRANDGRGAQASFWKLGDIFHSSPVQVRVPAREAPCLTGLENQCVATIFSPTDLPDQTSIDRSFVDALGNPIDAYQRYRLDQEARTRVVLAGANDGLVHAFDAGTLDVAASATSFDDVYSSGTGEERWAFIPPDLLPKLKDSVFAHQYLADGSIMVRDVWVDLNGDGVKNRNEFKTVAVIPEQSGGTQWTALDVTDPLAPTVLWAFPQPGSSDAQWVGYSWTDFAPRPPPVGPVKLKVAGGAGNDPTSRGFEERWIVMLNGGYDPTLTRGRAVFMLDAWTGQTLWRYTDADFRSVTGAPAGAAMLPVPGAVGLVDVGDTAKAAFDNDGFFDTATWGDLGGNLFVARFHDPGVVGGGGQVTNWFAARAFEEQRSGADTMDLRSRSEFYFMTANAYEGASRTLRTFIGSGNREQFLKGEAPSCGQDDVMACCQAGCSVTATTSDTFPDSCNVTRQFTCTGGVLTDVTHASTCGPAPACVAGSYTGSETLSFNCGPGTGTTSLSASMSCDAATATCPDPTPTIGATGVPITAGGAPAKRPKSRFYGVWSYGKDPHKVFGDAASARTFDQNRFTDVPFAGCTGPVDNGSGTCTLVETTQAIATANAANRTTGVTVTCAAGAKCEAGTFDAGWFYEYGVRCPTATCPTAPPWWDEKTGSGANVVQGCVPWNGFRPTLTGGGGDPCVAGGGQPIVNAYAAHFVSGTPTAACGYAADDGKVYTAQLHSSIAAPVGPRTRIAFGQDGTVTYSVLTLDAGAAPGQKAFGTRSELMEPVYWLEVSRQLHQCRHVDPTTCQ